MGLWSHPGHSTDDFDHACVARHLADCAENADPAPTANSDSECKDDHTAWQQFESNYYDLYVNQNVTRVTRGSLSELVYHKTLAKVAPGPLPCPCCLVTSTRLLIPYGVLACSLHIILRWLCRLHSAQQEPRWRLLLWDHLRRVHQCQPVWL